MRLSRYFGSQTCTVCRTNVVVDSMVERSCCVMLRSMRLAVMLAFDSYRGQLWKHDLFETPLHGTRLGSSLAVYIPNRRSILWAESLN